MGRTGLARVPRPGLGLIFLGAAAIAFAPPAAGGEVVTDSPDATARLIALADDNGALGVYFDASSAVVVVPRALVGRFPRSEAATTGLSVQIEPSDIDRKTVASIRKDLLGLRPTISPKVSYAFYFDLRAQTFVVQTEGSTDEFSDVSAQYPGVIEIEGGAKLELTSGRQADISPFWGGAKINVAGVGTCSSAFIAKKGSTTYMATAGHCYASGASVTSGGGAAEGTVTLRDYPTYETEFYSGKTYSATIYNGVNGDDSAHVAILGRRIAAVAIGQTGYCRTGWNSGRKCDWTVKDLDASFCLIGIPPTCTDDVYAFDGTIPSGGDSGGPIYKSYSGGALIVGTIIGSFSTPLGSTSYGEKMGTVLVKWGLTQVCAGTCVVQ